MITLELTASTSAKALQIKEDRNESKTKTHDRCENI